ncbi:MAG: SUMF1/EgtB/PvdO family nonheme iron enzyme [Bacteroidota bacterium]
MQQHTNLIISLLFVLAGFQVTGQNPTRSGTDRAIFFYVTDFQHGWEALRETKLEVEAIGQKLKTDYGFQVEYVPNPTKAEIKNKVLELNRRNYRAKDQLLLFFSMHGHFISDADRGYLIPANGKLPADDLLGDSWLSYEDLGTWISLNKCQHILLSLDACYSGAFGIRQSANERMKSYPGSVKDDAAQECKKRETRALLTNTYRYFSSGGLVRTPAQSKFAEAWLQALDDGWRKKVITTNDLYYAFGQVNNPAPEGGLFTRKTNGGDFVFIHKNACSSTPVIDKTADRNAWLSAKNANNLNAYKRYRADFPNGEFRPLANQRIAEMEAVQKEERDWETAKKKNTTKGYNDFIGQHPKSIYRDMAEYNRSQLEDESSFDDLPDMVFVKGGTFQMGSADGYDDEKPVHNVTLSDFYMHKNEVTVEDFSQFVAATNYRTDAEKEGSSYIVDRSKWVVKQGINWRHDTEGKIRPASEFNHPVVHVSWNDAVAYCNWRSNKDGLQKVYAISGSNVTANWNANGYRLPTEAEWEFAARSRGGNDKWAGTSSEKSLSMYCNSSLDDSKGKDVFEHTAPVGSFLPNGIGLYDMSGNVWEWCWDWKDYYPSTSQTNPHGPDTGSNRVSRGGSWYNSEALLSCTSRNLWQRGSVDRCVGFRVARSAP